MKGPSLTLYFLENQTDNSEKVRDERFFFEKLLTRACARAYAYI